MREKSQSQPQFNYVTMMVPVPLPATSENKDDKAKEVSVLGAFFWAIILILAFWFITGGYTALQ